MLVTARLSLFVVGLGLVVDAPAFAQTAIAHLSHVEGTVTRLHRFAPAVASVGVVLVDGDQIVTAVGRAELTFVDGSLMHLDQHTHVVIAAASRFRLIDGRVSLRTTTSYTAETSTGIVHVLPQGIFELTANATNRDVLVQVVEGDARIESRWGVESVTSTQTAFVSGPTGRPFVGGLGPRPHDSFALWCNSRYVAIAPPPTFLPYAHPTYRQFAYQGTRRQPRHDRNAGDVQVRGNRRRDRAARPDDRGERVEPEARPRQERPVATPSPKPKPVRTMTKAIRPR